MSPTAKKQTTPDKGQVKPEGQEESERLAREVEGVSEENKVEKLEMKETDHRKAKRRKSGNNTQ